MLHDTLETDHVKVRGWEQVGASLKRELRAGCRGPNPPQELMFAFRPGGLSRVTCGEHIVDLNSRWMDVAATAAGQNGGLLTVSGAFPMSVEAVAAAIAVLNRPLTVESLLRDIEPHPDDPCLVSGDVDWRYHNITKLPGSIGNLRIDGDFKLSYNKLATLPSTIGKLEVSGDLDLSFNLLGSLPDAFADISVGGSVWLSHNRLAALPDGFSGLRPVEGISLYNNQLTTLPENFGELAVHGDLHLGNNRLLTLPASFGSIRIAGTLHLQSNHLDPRCRSLELRGVAGPVVWD